MKKLKLLSLVLLLLIIYSCFLSETFMNLDNIPEIQKNELLNAPSEITFENKDYILYSGLEIIEPRVGRPFPLSNLFREKDIKYFYIDIRYIFDSYYDNKYFYDNFKVSDLYILNKKTRFYFEINIGTNKLLDIRKVPNNYIEDIEDIFIIKMEDKTKKTYFLRTKTKNEKVELEKRISDYYKKGATK